MNNQPENDMVLGGIDAFLPIEKAQKSILSRVDEVMDEAVEKGNPDIAFKAMRGLLGVSQVSGLAFAKFIYTMSFQWKQFNRKGTFEDTAEEEFGRNKVTIKRNFNVWEMLVDDNIPKEYREKLKNMPIRCLIPIATMWKQGWEVETNQWMNLANAPDPSTVNKLIREIKKVEPKKGSMQIQLERDGTLYAWKDDIRYMVGHLNLDDGDEVVQAAILRLTGDGRVLVK